jgi:medium-chain acyl-[acyl-carrier-protein] hydrolase
MSEAPRRFTLLCFPHSGASGWVFASWSNHLPAGIDVRGIDYPGRGARLHEQPLLRLQALSALLVDELAASLQTPFAVFGHCMGALIGFEFARRIEAVSGLRPFAMVAAGCRGPALPLRRPLIHTLADFKFVEALRRLGGTPAEILETPQIARFFLPVLRADFELADTYVYQPSAPAAFPLFAYGGADDEGVTDAELEGWADESTRPLVVRRYPGDHFFVRSAETAMLRDLDADLRRALADTSGKPDAACGSGTLR